MSEVLLQAAGRTVRLDVGDPTDHIASCILEASRFYEGRLLRDARRRARPGTAIDVGAHIGNHTLFFAVICGWPVVALEPWPPSFARLSANVARNDVKDRVRLIPAAAGARCYQASMVPPPAENTGLARLTDGSDVSVIRLDDLAVEDVNVLKIDTEGGSANVIAGGMELIQRWRPVIYAEAATLEERQAVEDLLLPEGYRPFGPFGSTPVWGFA